MNANFDLQPTGNSEAKRVAGVVPRILRLAVAVLVALMALAGLCGRLAEARRQALADHTAPTTLAAKGSTYTLPYTAQYISTRCRHPLLGGTKHVDPLDPDTGGVVTITFVITGIGPRPADVVLVHDVSGSMLAEDTPSGQTRLAAAQTATITFVNQLADTDRVGVVAFSETMPLTPALPLTTDIDAAIAAIRSLEAQEDWDTNIGDGIQAGHEELISSTRWSSQTAKAMILLSDGGASVPPPRSEAERHARDRARAAGECGILIYTLGFGRGVSETLMQKVADLGGGEYYFSPDDADVGTVYQEIALELRNLVITDVLRPGVALDCGLLPSAWQCVTGSGLTTITIPISNSELIADPLTLSFTATVNLDPGYEGPINADGSGMCYDGPGGRKCQSSNNPTVTVGGRKITGVVFEDLALDGYFDGDEDVLPGVELTTSTGLTSVTDIDGVYVFRTATEPTLTVGVKIPTGFVSPTSESTRVPPSSGIYQWDVGLYPIGGVSLDSLRVDPDPEYHGESAALHYTVINLHGHYRIVSGGVVVVDSLGRTLDERDFNLDPGGTITLSSSPFTVPQDIAITLTATGTYGAGGFPFSDQATLTLCPTDVYEPDDDAGQARSIDPDKPQVHDFYTSGDEDWVRVRLHRGDRALCSFTARPLGPDGVSVCLTLHYGGNTSTDCNLNPQSPVHIVKMLACTAGDACDHLLQVQSGASGCWTDYELSIEKTPYSEVEQVWLPVILKGR